MPELTVLATALGVGLLLILILWLSIRIVNRGDKLVVYRLGNTDDSLVKGPGLVLLIPFIDRPQRVNLREQYVEVPSQTAITKDNVTIPIDFLIYWRIVDPLKSVVNVQDFVGALAGVATTNLRAVVGDFLLDDVLSKRDQINEVLADEARRDHRELGRQDHARRDPRDHAAARHPRVDEPDALRRADAARGHHRIRGRAAVGDQRRGGPEAVRDPQGRGRAPGRDPPCRGLQRGADPHLQRRHGRRPEDDDAAVPRGAEADRGEPVDEVRDPDRVHAAARADPGVHRSLGRRWGRDGGTALPVRRRHAG